MKWHPLYEKIIQVKLKSSLQKQDEKINDFDFGSNSRKDVGIVEESAATVSEDKLKDYSRNIQYCSLSYFCPRKEKQSTREWERG